MKILISAAEASSDVHGAHLLAALKSELASEDLQAFGIGGPALEKEGLRILVHAKELLAMGFGEVIRILPRVFSAVKEVAEAAEQEKPDIVILIDYPDFHFRLARKLSRLGIPLVYYIPPKVWAWRKRRIEFLKRHFAIILCILPFEEEFYLNKNISARYVGNPLLDELPLTLTREKAREELKLGSMEAVLVLMPGSRKAELDAHLELMLGAAEKAAYELAQRKFLGVAQKLRVLIPLPWTANREAIEARIDQWASGKDLAKLDIRVSHGNAHVCMAAADAGVIKSGTSTLEAGLLRCPHCIVYKPSKVSTWIFKHIVRYRGPVGLVNLTYGCKAGDDLLVPEILCEDAQVETLKNQILNLMTHEDDRKKMLKGFDQVRSRMMGGSFSRSPSVRAAQEIVGILRTANPREAPRA